MHLTVNFITKLPLVAGKNIILVVYNRLFKITHFVATTEETLVKGLEWLFRDNMQKLYKLLESVVSDRGPQFVAELTKKLNRMFGIKTKLSTSFHLQTDRQTEQINQELEQYLKFFVDYRQKDQSEWLALIEFVINNKVYSTTKISPFMMKYGRKLRNGVDIRRKEKVEKVTEFVERMKKVQEEVGAAATNFIQLVSPQPVDRFSQTKLCQKAPSEGYLHICGMYKSNNKQLRYQVISNYKIFVC